jgi:hypothetical protein
MLCRRLLRPKNCEGYGKPPSEGVQSKKKAKARLHTWHTFTHGVFRKPLTTRKATKPVAGRNEHSRKRLLVGLATF